MNFNVIYFQGAGDYSGFDSLTNKGAKIYDKVEMLTCKMRGQF